MSNLAHPLSLAAVYPRRMGAMLPYLDWVGLDVNGPDAHFDGIVGRSGTSAAHRENLAQVLTSHIDFECRTTVHWRDLELENLHCLALDLASQGVARYAIQVARKGQCLDEACARPVTSAPSTAELHKLVHRLKPAFRRLELRE